MMMNGEVNTLSKLAIWISRMQEASREADIERKRILDSTVGAKKYCEIEGISKPTLIKRRNLGLIPFVMLGAEYRYFLNLEGGQENG